MVMVITVDGTGDPGTGLGRIVPLVDGMPPEGLIALVDYEGGTVGQPFAGPFLDKSGNGNHLTLKPGYAAPVQRSYGIDVAPHGAPMGAPIPGTLRNFTVIVAATPLVPGGESGVITNFWSANQTSLDDGNPANTNATPNNYPVLNLSTTWALFANTAAIAWPAPDRRVLTGSPALSTPAVLAVSISGTEQVGGVAGVARTQAHGQAHTEIASAAIGAFFDGTTARPNMVFGPWPNGSSRTAAPVLAQMHSVAVYERSMSPAQITEVLDRMHTRLVARGVLPAA